MPQLGTGRISRQDILLPAGSQTSNATALFIYSGEVTAFSGAGFSSPGGTDFVDQLQILLDPGITDPAQIIDFSTNPPIPIVLPTSWNAGGSGGEPVIAINSPTLNWSGGSAIPAPLGGPGLYIFSQVTVQHGSLLNVQFQVAVRVNLGQ